MLNIIYRPNFPSCHPSSNGSQQFDKLLAAWKVIFPASEENPDQVDFEDWVENVTRFESALREYPDANFFILTKQQGCQNLQGNQTVLPDDGLFLGIHLEEDNDCQSYVDQIERQLINNYALTKTFQEFSGRQIALCGVACPNSPDMLETIKDMALKGHQSVFIKVNRPKYQVERLDFKSVQDAEYAYFHSHTCYAVMHLEGYDDAFIIQEYVPMSCEYRMIVIDHQVVSGAGCIEEFTPLDNRNVFDVQLREDRHERSEIIDDHQLVDQYVAFAKHYARSMEKENDRFANYTLDLALNDKNRVIAIECNPLDNFGLYAMNYDVVLNAQVRAHLHSLGRQSFINGPS